MYEYHQWNGLKVTAQPARRLPFWQRLLKGLVAPERPCARVDYPQDWLAGAVARPIPRHSAPPIPGRSNDVPANSLDALLKKRRKMR